MANQADETVKAPFTSFNFSVEINVPGVAPKVCNAAFSDCDGLEMTMDVKTIREGGNNGKQHRLTGPLNFGTLTLKRGMTENFDLWHWLNQVLLDPSLRADAEVVLLSEARKRKEGETDSEPIPRARFQLSRCVPVKLKAPVMNAKDGGVAIEELQLAYESLSLKE